MSGTDDLASIADIVARRCPHAVSVCEKCLETMLRRVVKACAGIEGACEGDEQAWAEIIGDGAIDTN